MRIQRIVHQLFSQNFFVLAFAIILSTLFGILIEIPAGLYPWLLGTLLSVYVLYTILTIGFIRQEIDGQLDQVNVISLWMTEQQQENNEGYIKSRDVVLSAQHSILVLSHEVPENAQIDFSETRKSYLADGIEQVIKNRLQQSDAPSITYKRIIQVSNDSYKEGTLYRSAIKGDQQTFPHCERVFELLNDQLYNNVYVDFRASEPIPSFPNTLIVDNRYMLFALATHAPRHASDPNIDRYINVGVFLIEDRSGKTIQSFISAFDRFFENGQPINKLIDDMSN